MSRNIMVQDQTIELDFYSSILFISLITLSAASKTCFYILSYHLLWNYMRFFVIYSSFLLPRFYSSFISPSIYDTVSSSRNDNPFYIRSNSFANWKVLSLLFASLILFFSSFYLATYFTLLIGKS